MGKFAKVGSRLVHTDGAREVWASDAAPVALLPVTNTINLVGKTISFPDFQKNNNMVFGLFSGGNASSAVSFGTILPGEYGPTKSGVYLLSEEIVGTVPVGVNFLDVRATLTRTKDPDAFAFFTVKKTLAEGKQTFLAGGCSVLEGVGRVFKRIIKIELVGTNVYLRRFQSVADRAYSHTFSVLKTGTQTWTSGPYGPWGDKWTHGGDPRGWLSVELDRKTGGNINKQRGGSNAPSLVDNSDFSSIWTGDFEIRPGIIRT